MFLTHWKIQDPNPYDPRNSFSAFLHQTTPFQSARKHLLCHAAANPKSQKMHGMWLVFLPLWWGRNMQQVCLWSCSMCTVCKITGKIFSGRLSNRQTDRGRERGGCTWILSLTSSEQIFKEGWLVETEQIQLLSWLQLILKTKSNDSLL